MPLINNILNISKEGFEVNQVVFKEPKSNNEEGYWCVVFANGFKLNLMPGGDYYGFMGTKTQNRESVPKGDN